ncbi:MAG: hypothetical protein JRH00_06565 [Deltaproteobacteria bacterium]|nr:hypothetical protein [Deltaproteobacteria bacterium]
MPEERIDFNFMATGIGSVPFLDLEPTCREMAEMTPLMPFWPQFVRRSHLEDMSVQYSEGLPLLEVRERSLVVSGSGDREKGLVEFYESYLAGDLERFSVTRDYAPGLYSLLELIEASEVDCGPFIKGQTVGPLTFTAGIKDLDGKPILHDPELSGAMVRGLAIKALWQVRQLERSGKRPVIFMDEPYLSGFGSAFSPVQRHEVIDTLRIVMDYLRENSQALIGIHCCGNTDWSMLLEAGPDIINFDAFDYMDHFLLYREDLVRFIDGGGAIAWGIVPTSGFTGEESVDGLLIRLEKGLNRVTEWGVDRGLLARRSILTPSCGMGTMAPEEARAAMALLSDLSRRCREGI